jgi:Zn finger protein HypA/HybF involved in hydrogenase expression
MHEIGIVEDLVKCIQKEVKLRQIVSRIEKVHIRLGKAMGVTEVSLKFWFENFSRGTELEGADLEVSLIDGGKIFVDAFEVT